MNAKILLLLALVAVAAADRPRPSYSAPPPPPQPTYRQPQPAYRPSSSEEFEVPKYGYEWGVQDGDSGNDFNHQETRDDDNTQGSYSVQLPDGRLQTVTYYVDGDSGYIAEVDYKGEARFDSVESREYGYGK